MDNKTAFILRDNKWMWTLKITAALFQVPATWNVFTNIFIESGRPLFEAYITTFFAILLIDVFFLVTLYILESNELTTLQKVPWVMVAIGLLISNITIGILDEGSLAFAPRIGFIGLVLADIFTWVTEFLAVYFSREQQEKRLRNKQVIRRRKLMHKAWKQGIKTIYDDLVNVQVQREYRAIGADLDQDVSQTKSVSRKTIPNEYDKYIFETGDGTYGWKSPITNKEYTVTSTNKPYSYSGAKRALMRHIKGQLK